MAKKEYEIEREGVWNKLSAKSARVKGVWLYWRDSTGTLWATAPGRWREGGGKWRERIPAKKGDQKHE